MGTGLVRSELVRPVAGFQRSQIGFEKPQRTCPIDQTCPVQTGFERAPIGFQRLLTELVWSPPD
jgi:hypothetical protein